MADDGFREIGNADAWAPAEVGDSITGEYTGTQVDVGPNNSKMHNLRTEEGDKGVWGSTVLDGRFEQVRVGDIVRVTYQGLSANKGKFGKPFKLWKVEAKPNPNPTAAPAPRPADKAPEIQDAKLDADGNIDLSDLPY